MFDLVIHNARLYPMSAQLEQKDLGRMPAKDYLNAQNTCVLPGLIDCHTHIMYAGERSKEHMLRRTGATYADIHTAGGGIYSSVNAVRNASEADLIEQSLSRINNLKNEGVTALEIKSGYGLDTKNELKMLRAIKSLKGQLPMHIVSTFLGAHTIPKHLSQTEYLDEIIQVMLPTIAQENLADAVDIYVEDIAFNTNSMQQLFSAAKKYNLHTRVHAEQLSNQQAAQNAAKLGALSADHLEYLDKAGAQAMGEHGTVAILLPNAFYFLNQTQKPPAPIPSLLTAMHLGVHLFDLSPVEACLGVTLYAAKALGLEQQMGSIEIGKQANLGLWDIPSPEFLCYQLGGVLPQQVLFNGIRKTV